MPTVTLNKAVFEKLVGKKLPLEELKDRISMLGTDLENIGGNEIEVEVFPDRPDMLSEQGFARAFSSFIGAKTGLRSYKVRPSKEKVIIDASVKKIRPYTACAIIRNMKFDNEKIKEAIQIQEKLHTTYGRNRKKVAIGIYPFEKIKLPIRFVAKNPANINFRPLESQKEMNGLQILRQHPVGREYAHLLEGLKTFPVFIDANNEVLSMPPIINSHTTGKITEKTKEVFIECSGFDFEVLKKCLNIIVTAFADMGGEIYSMELQYGSKKEITPDLEPEKMDIDIKYVNKLLGLDLNEKDIKKYLEKMGYGYENKKVFVPSYRADVLHQVDLIEDIAIAYGYENFKEALPEIVTIAEENKLEVFKKRVGEILAGLKLLEVKTYHLSNMERQCRKMNLKIELVELENALTADYNAMRAWLIPCLLEVLQSNKHRDYPQNIFDMGVVFKKDLKEETKVSEPVRACVALCDAEADFTKIKQVLDYLFRMLNIEYSIQDTEHDSFIPGRVGRILVGKEKVGYIGEIHPKVLEAWQLDMPVAALEINLSDLLRIKP